MSDGIWIALIGLLATTATVAGSIVAARINTQLKGIGKDAAEARHQTKNSHDENLRDAMDRQHDETTKAVEAVAAAVSRLDASVGGLHEDVRLLHQADGRQTDNVAHLRAEIPGLIDARIMACRTRDARG